MTLALITLLMVKHILADYVFQYSWMIKDKGIYGAKGGIAHSGLHGILTLFVLLVFNIPFLYSLFLSLLDSVIHYHIDFAKNNVWKDKKLTPADQQFWILHGVDQFAHFLTYVGIVLLCV